MHTFRAVVGDPQQWITAIEMKAGRHAEFQKTGEEEVENRWGEPLNVRFASKESIPGIKRGMKSLYQSTIEKRDSRSGPQFIIQLIFPHFQISFSPNTLNLHVYVKNLDW